MFPKPSTMFGDISARNVTFLIDISGSMYRKLKLVKKHLIKAINELLLCSNTMFNIIAFSEELERFSSKAVPCTPETILLATDWIRSLECKTTTNTRDALLFAFDDYSTEVVYLVTDGLPNQSPTTILKELNGSIRLCPIHCIYITGSEDDNIALMFLEELAAQSNGSLHALSFHKDESIKHMIKVFQDIHDEKDARRSLKRVSFENGRELRNGVGQHVMPGNIAASLMLGLKVLAQNYADGFYHLGEITEIVGNNKFRVEFLGNACRQNEAYQQDTWLQDLIAYEDASRHDISEGDKVLAPIKSNKKFAPATVVKGMDLRQKDRNDYEDMSITVTFFNGEIKDVDAQLPVWISDEHFDRIQRRLSLPESVRRGCSDMKSPPTRYESHTSFRPHFTEAPLIRADSSKDMSRDSLKEKIEQQIKEGERLLQELKLEELGTVRRASYSELSCPGDKEWISTYKSSKIKKPYIDVDSFGASGNEDYQLPFKSTPKPKRDAWVEIHNHSPNETSRKRTENKKDETGLNHSKEEDYHKHRLELLNHWEKHKNCPKYSPYPPKQENVESKIDEPHRRHHSVTKKARKHRKVLYHPNVMSKLNESKMKSRTVPQPRLNAKEYQTFDGVKFPQSTDRKFRRNGFTGTWTPNDVLTNQPTEQDYNIITNMPVQSYSTNFINGFGARDLPRDIKSHMKDEFQKAAKESRKQKVINEKGRKEKIIRDRQEFHRFTTARREKKWEEQAREMKEGEEKNQKHKREMKESIERFFKEKEENAQRFKQERLEKMRRRREAVQKMNMEHEHAAFESNEKHQVENTSNENSRRKAFESNLQREIMNQEKKLERLRKIHEARLNGDDVRRDRAFKSSDLNSHVKDQSRQMYRASILP